MEGGREKIENGYPDFGEMGESVGVWKQRKVADEKAEREIGNGGISVWVYTSSPSIGLGMELEK